VSPYYEDDLGALRDLVGASQIVMGSDWPHAEGLSDPIRYIDDLRRYDIPDEECRLIMRENAAGLIRPRVRVSA
jgi:predicted TIM-barrel fold metal-dependent hydrolase